MEAMKFLRSITIEQFKQEQNVEAIQVVKSPRTQKLFITWGGDTRGIMSKSEITRPMMSFVEVVNETTGELEKTWMLHNEPENKNVVATF